MNLYLILPIAIGLIGASVASRLSAAAAARLGAAVAGVAFASFAALAAPVLEFGAVTAPFWGVPALGLDGGLRLDALGLVFALMISGIGFFIFLYAERYLDGDARLKRLSVFLMLFMTAMLGAVTADDAIVLFVFWEVTSLTSFFLIGFNHEKAGSRDAALQAMLITAGGGLAMLAGLILLIDAAGTASIAGMIAAREQVLASDLAVPAMLLVLLGCFTKSAQLPFHFWLPNAMAAPTPVSAYLHSATMVKLGVYLLARFNPLFQELALWQGMLIWFGLGTGVLAGILALRETDLKRILAYTTLTALGTLVMLIGLAPELSLTAAIVFMLAHACYKAALFMAAGIIDHEAGSRDLSALGGLRRAMPKTAIAVGLACLSMAGLPPFIGFLGKELIYEALLHGSAPSLVVLIGAIFINAVNVAVALLFGRRIFFGQARPTPKTPHDPPFGMLAGPAVLAALGLAGGVFTGWLGEYVAAPAASAMAGGPILAELALWHGFNAVLGLSGLTLLCGFGLFLLWPRLQPGLANVQAIDRYGADRAYGDGLAGLLGIASGVTNLVQHGQLRGYLRVLFLSIALGVWAALLLQGGLAMPEFDRSQIDVRALGFLALIGGAAATILAKTLFSAVVSSGLVGFAAALLFLFFGAPDVALTQFAVETLLVVILCFALTRLTISTRDDRKPRDKAKDGAIALACGGAVTALLLAILALPFDDRLSEWFGQASFLEAKGRNVVNVILVDFRALDTLGEITVLAIAAFAVLALLRPMSKEEGRS